LIARCGRSHEGNKEVGVGFLNSKKMPMRSHEMIYVFYNKQPTYNIVGNHIATPRNDANRISKTNSCYGEKKGQSYDYTPRLPLSILDFERINNGKKRYHVTEKPIPLLEWLIKYYSNEGDTILDPTMGSGSTGVACKNLNRKFIGIEMDKVIFDIAFSRINKF
jgi:site-specific DNA-methyltransferase (adenine-specific)